MYCPICFNETLILSNKGIVHVIINKKQLDNGRFLFNMPQDTAEEILQRFREKADEFLKWYSKFQNIENIHRLELVSNSFICSHGCKLDGKQKMSVIDILIPKDQIITAINKVAEKYHIKVIVEADQD